MAVCESPIDALSLATIRKQATRAWNRYHFLSLSGTSPPALLQYLSDHPEIDHVYMFLDNDKAGWDGMVKIQAALMQNDAFRNHITTTEPPPIGKDYNEYLQHLIREKRKIKQTINQPSEASGGYFALKKEFSMKRPFAHICSPFKGNEAHNTEKAREYCRKAYEAGFTPICPHLLFPQSLDESIPEERKAGMEMANALLRRCHVLLVCGNTVSEGMMCEILYAHRLNITATTLDGILTVKAQRRQPQAEKEAAGQ